MIPLIYVVGSGNDVLDNYLLDQVRQVVGQEVPVMPVNESEAELNPGIPIVTIGHRALTTALGKYPQSPILATLVSREYYRAETSATSTRSDKEPERPVSAIYYDVPLINQALTGKAILPQSRRIALLATPKSSHLYSELLSQLPKYDLEAQMFVVNSSSELIPALVRALYYGDFVLAAQDPSIYNPSTIKHILLTAYRRNIMVIGPSQAYVKAGSLASSYTPYSAVAQALVSALEQWFREGFLPKPAYPTNFNIRINEQVGRSLNIPLPSEASVKARVVQQLREHEMPTTKDAAADAASLGVLP
ncbi:MAG: ABC transporter substrate-binding protein [Marinobacter sp.]